MSHSASCQSHLSHRTEIEVNRFTDYVADGEKKVQEVNQDLKSLKKTNKTTDRLITSTHKLFLMTELCSLSS